MANINAEFPSKYWKADHLENPITLTIKKLEKEQVDRESSETKPVIYFEEDEKGVVLNKTRSNDISDLYSTDYLTWPGQKVTLYAGQTNFKGKTIACVAIREPSVTGQATIDTDTDDVPY